MIKSVKFYTANESFSYESGKLGVEEIVVNVNNVVIVHIMVDGVLETHEFYNVPFKIVC